MANKHGTIPLPPSSVKVWYDPTLEEGQQPETTPIAHFESTPNDDCPTGSMLDVNASFVVYAVKNGLVRVLDRRSTLRTLLRGHESKVTDVAFFQNGDVLGTIGGNVLIWRIFTRESELTSEKLLEIPSDLPNICRLVWHPFNPNQFWLMHDNALGERTASLVETTRITTVPHESETHAVCQLFGENVVMDGALQLPSAGGVNNLCWSGRDARHVLTAHADGGIRLWDVKQHESSENTETPQPKCVMTILQEEAVTRCFFLPHDNVATNASSDPSEQLTGPFVTATDNNSCITLWSPFCQGGQLPTKVAVFGIDQPSVDGYNLIPGFGQNSIGTKPPASFLLMSDRSEGKVICVALKSEYDAQNRAILCGFDYLVPFGIMHPIYSWAIMCGLAQNIDEDDIERDIGPQMDMQLYSVQSRAVQLLTLTHAMCVPPNSAWDESNPPEGIVRVEALEQTMATAPMATVDVTNNINGFEEDYELEEEEAQFEEYEEDEDDVAPEASDLPSPEKLTPVEPSGGNAFANWLGSIVGGGKGGESAVPTPATKGSKTPEEEKLPPPPPPPTPIVAVKSAPTRMPDELIPGLDAAPVTSRHSPSFLSPMELIQNAKPAAGSDLDNAAGALPMTRTEAAKVPKENRKKKTTPKKSRSRSPKPKKKPVSSNGGKKGGAPPMPVPSADGKIAILKREDASTASAAVPSSAAAASLDTTNLEDALKRALSAHFKKQESVMVNEIQRTVRAEVQSNVIPTLSKTITQTMEQSVVKPLQAAITKSSKESTKVRTQEVIDAVTGNVEEPLKEAFHESMKTVMIPAYESATRQMFSQISSTLDQGLSFQAQDGSSAKLLAEMSAKMDSMTRVMQALSSEVTQLRSVVSATHGLGQPLGGMGGGPAPEPPVDKMLAVRNEILALLNRHAYEVAFTKALSASTAEMAVFCCKNAELSDVLGGNSPALSQPILLCLMQQLGAVLVSSTDSDLKTELDWLQEIALTLDPHDESIHKHVSGVLQQLVASINAKMAQGDPALRRPLQMLLQVIRGMQ